MRKESRPTAAMPMAYQLPEAEYRALTRVRDHLRLLARLAEPCSVADGDESPLSPGTLTRCLCRFADDLDDIVSGAWWPNEQGR